MKNKILLVLIALLTIVGAGEIQAQKKNPRIASGKNLYNTLSAIFRQAKVVPTKDLKCEPHKLLKSIPRKKLLPTQEQLIKEIGKIVDDSLSLKTNTRDLNNHAALEHLSNSKTKTEFIKKLPEVYNKGAGFNQAKFDRFYYSVRRAQKSGFKIFESTLKHGECSILVETIIKPTKFTWDLKKYSVSNVDWEITTKVSITCPCTKNNKFKVKSAKFEYSAICAGPLIFNTENYTTDFKRIVDVKYGLRFGKIQNPMRKLVYLDCCRKLDDPVKDGAFIAPDEEINDNNTLLDTSLGIGFGDETETEAVFAGGVLFNVTEVGGNPLFVGPKATVNTTSIGGDDIKETRILIGPTAEYQIPVGGGNTKILAGINSGYLFGSLDAFGSNRDLSGFAANAYSGAQVKLGNNIALSVLLNFLEYSNITFKSDNEEFENTVGNTAFLTDRGAISIGVRIGLDKN